MSWNRYMRVVVTGVTCASIGDVTFAAAHAAGPLTCPPQAALANWSASTFTPVPFFLAGEQAGAVLDAPAHHYPIEILRIEIDWASQVGGAGSQIEQAIHIYPAGLPNPGTPQFTLLGPTLTDGITNVFDISGMAGNKIVGSGPFTVTLEFLNTQSAGSPFAPSVVADGDGCQSGKNAVFALPGGWGDACTLGVTGDWVFSVVYRRTSCDCNSNGVFDDDDLTAGTSFDCNANDIPDACDLAAGTSPDCNATGAPDECELTANDCDTNGTPDECDPDFDNDGTIDACDDDIDDDGILNPADACDYTPAGASIITDPQDPAYGTLRHDSDGDCDCDLADFARFQAEFTGPG